MPETIPIQVTVPSGEECIPSLLKATKQLRDKYFVALPWTDSACKEVLTRAPQFTKESGEHER